MSDGGLFRSLHNRNYRLFASGQAISLIGTWMQRVAQDWLVLELSGNSGTALGIVVGLQFAPTLLFGLYGGVLADRYDKRRLLIAAQTVMGIQAVLLGLLVVTGSAQLWHVYALAALLGTAAAIDVPTRQAFVVELVGKADVPNAVSLNSAIFNAARIIGPAIAGVMIAAGGTAPVFLVNGFSFIAVLAGLMAIRTDQLRRRDPVARAKGQLRDGIRYVRNRSDLLMPIVLVGVIGTFGLNFQLTLALMAKTEFARGASSFGLLASMFALGSLIGALASARRTVVRQRVLLGSALAFGVLEVLTGLMPTFWTFALMLVPTGAAVLSFTTAANATLQLGSSAEMRGRVMALYILVFLGGTPVGGPVVGWLAEEFGARSSLLIGGSVSALATAAVAVMLMRAQSLKVRIQVSPAPHMHIGPVRIPHGRQPANELERVS